MKTAGLVLAGGRSTRFGSEKALATLGGRALLTWSLTALAPSCAAVAVSARPGGGAAALAIELGLEVLADDPAHAEGPLAGIAAGLAWAEGQGADRLVTLPCDAPGIDAEIVAALLAGDGVVVARTPDGLQPLASVWPVSARSALTRALKDGAHPPVHRVLAGLGARPVDFPAAPFANVNRPEDLG